MMRKHTLFLSAAVLSLAGVVACNSDSLTDINKSPNAPETTTPYLLFPNAVTGFQANIRGSSFEHGFEALWVQHYSEINYVEADVYKPRESTAQTFWTAFFSGSLQDLNYLVHNANDPTTGVPDKKLLGPALTMRAYMFHELTDLWGDIPYTEFGKGDPTGAGLTPKYDAQQVVYDSIFAGYNTAVTMMTTPGSTGGYGAADPVYKGSLAKWIRLANSLHARAGLRLSRANPGKAMAEVQAALAGPVLTSNADNAFVAYPGDGVNNNPLYTNWRSRDDQRLSKTFVDTLAQRADPRLAMFAAQTPDFVAEEPGAPEFAGAPNGVGVQLGAGPVTSRPNRKIRLATSPSYIMTYAELLFIRAEAAERGWVAGDAAALFKAGITASMEQWGVDSVDIAAYLKRPENVYVPGATGLQQIALQKWIALFNVETQAFAEWRRLGYPVLTPGPQAAYTTVPRRMPYPPIESSLNGANLEEATARQGGVAITNRTWWDK
jgi:hypothetical protein